MTNQQFGRHQRVGDQIQRELAHLIQFEIKDPRLGLVTVSGVRVSRDLSVANVYITVMTGKESEANDTPKVDKHKAGDQVDGEIEQSLKVLERSAGFLRKMLSRSMQLRVVPQLKFHYDESIVRGQTLSSLIDKARNEDKQLLDEVRPSDLDTDSNTE